MKNDKSRDIAKILADGVLIDQAMRTAARDALLAHRRAGQPMVIWRDGRIVLVPPDQFDSLEDARSRRKR